MDEFPDLHILLQKDPVAQEYYDGLLNYVQDQISTQGQGVKSAESLTDDSEDFTHGSD